MLLLAALDFSSSTDAILKTTRDVAARMSAEVVLLHVARPDPDFVGYEAGPQSVRDQVAETFREEHGRVQEHARNMRDAGVEARGLLVQGATAAVILEEAERLDADLIVVGSHGHGAVHHLLVGSTSEEVLRKASCPVLVVPTRS